MAGDGEHSVTQWIGDLRTGNRDEASRRLSERYFERLARLCSLADESLPVTALLKLEGHSNEDIARSLDCGMRTVERKLEVIRKRWTAEGAP
jgi:hypothetical protein